MQRKNREIAIQTGGKVKFTESHEWIDTSASKDIGVVGVSQFAQKELGDIVFVELPEVGKQVKAGAEIAVLESTKAAADVYAPVSGTIVEVNERLSENPELVNASPEKEGWLFKIKLSNPAELSALKNRDDYLKI